MMDGRCATCTWWTPSPPEYPGWGVCELTRQVGNGVSDEPVYTTLAYASGNANEEGEADDVLVTHADFGCVQHEEKNGDDAEHNPSD